MEHTPVPKRDISLDDSALDGALDDSGDDANVAPHPQSRALVPLAPQTGPLRLAMH